MRHEAQNLINALAHAIAESNAPMRSSAEVVLSDASKTFDRGDFTNAFSRAKAGFKYLRTGE
jgi:phage gpG-like protein